MPLLHTSTLGESDHWIASTWGPVITYVGPATLTAGALPPGMNLFVDTGGSSHLGLEGIPTAAGVYNFSTSTLMSNGSHNLDDWQITIALASGCPAITVTPATVDDFLEGGDYTGAEAITFAAAGGVGPYTWDAPAGTLPAGLALSSGGVLSGTPSAVESQTVTIRATDANGCRGVRSITLTVVAPDPIVVLPVPPLEDGRRGWLYVAIFTAEGGFGDPFTFDVSAGALPPGLALSPLGVLAGLIGEAGSYTFTVRATDPLGLTGEREYTLDVSGLRIIVGGDDVTIELEAVEIELTLNRQATARLVCGDGYIPARGAPVLIFARDGVTPIFSGVTLVRRVKGMAASNPANATEVDCVDNSIYFDEADPVTIVSTVSQALEDVIAEIVSQSLAVYGITYTPTATGKTVPPITWQEITVADAFKRITDATGVVFRVIPLSATVVAELDVFVPLDDAAPVTITDAEINAFDLEWSDPTNLPRNTVDLLCGPTGTAIVTQDWTADGIATTFEVDIQAVIGDYWPGLRSHAFLGPTGAGNFSDGDTITLGSVTYTMRAALVGDVAGEVLIGATVNDSLANIVAAIVGNVSSGVYAPSTTAPNPDADGFMRYPDQLAVNARTVGVAGDSIAVASSHEAIALWYGEGGIPLDHLQLGSDPSGAAGWTQGYVLENGTTGVPIGGDQYTWDVTAGRGTITAATPPAAGTVLELKYLAVMPFHVIYSTGSPRITFREAHPEIDNYAAGLALAQRIHARESADRRELEIGTDVDGFLPGQDLTVDTSYRGGIVADFLIATVRIVLVNAELWEYSITAQQSDEYAGSFVEQWKALTGGGSGSSSSPAPAPVTPGDVSAAGDVYTDGRNAFRSDQSLGGHRLTFVENPASAQDAATKASQDAGDAATLASAVATAEAYADTGDAAITAAITAAHYIKRDGSVAFTGDQSMGTHKITDVVDPTSGQDAATKNYVDTHSGGASSVDRGWMGVGTQPYSIVTNPLIVTPTGTTLTFFVSFGVINTGDATVYANVQLQDLQTDDTIAVIGTSLVSFGGQALAGLVHITGLTAGKEYVATATFAAKRNATSIAGAAAYMFCLDLVTHVDAASIETAEASSSTTYGDLATAGPSVTSTVPSDGVVGVIFGDSENRVQTGTSSLQVLITGANAITAADLVGQATSGAQNCVLQGAFARSRLTPGSTTFKLQYKSDGGSNTRYARWLAVLHGVFGGTPVTKGVSSVLTAEATTSAAYTALTTADSVTLTTGTSVLVLFSVNTVGSGVLDTSVAVAVSGATTIAAADGVNNAKNITSSTAGAKYHVGRGIVMTVNAGSNTFSLKYKVSTGTGTFSTRILCVIRLN